MNCTAIPMTCQHCGRPIAGPATHIGHFAYHPECTHGPSYQTHYGTPPPLPVRHYTVPMDDERVRQIVREEIAAALKGCDLTGLKRFGGRPA